jgi:hypothetical protein
MIYTRPDHIQFLEEELKAITDEANEVKNLQPLKDIAPMPGQLVLSTFYFSSKTEYFT